MLEYEQADQAADYPNYSLQYDDDSAPPPPTIQLGAFPALTSRQAQFGVNPGMAKFQQQPDFLQFQQQQPEEPVALPSGPPAPDTKRGQMGGATGPRVEPFAQQDEMDEDDTLVTSEYSLKLTPC